MPSNNDLITSIGDEAIAKGVDVPATNDMTNAQLVETLKGLRALPTPTLPVVDETPSVDETPAVAPYTIAKGKSLTSLKGILTEGDPVEPDYLAGDDDDFQSLINRGYIDEN